MTPLVAVGRLAGKEARVRPGRNAPFSTGRRNPRLLTASMNAASRSASGSLEATFALPTAGQVVPEPGGEHPGLAREPVALGLSHVHALRCKLGVGFGRELPCQILQGTALANDPLPETHPVFEAQLQLIQVALYIVEAPEVRGTHVGGLQGADEVDAPLPRFRVEVRRRGGRPDVGVVR